LRVEFEIREIDLNQIGAQAMEGLEAGEGGESHDHDEKNEREISQ
jgi:hypothetical protein